MTTSARSYQAGVDEAGLGPILGPLVVAGVAMEGPTGGDPWKLLAARVCRDHAEKGKVRVADSKKVYQGEGKLERLEHTVLACVAAWRGEVPRTLHGLLAVLGVDEAPLRSYPWYGELELALPLQNDAGLLELQADGLAKAMRRAGLGFSHLEALPVDAGEFNALLAATDNKSKAHFRSYARVIGSLLGRLPDGAHLVADRCGGLMRYLPALRGAWPDAKLERLREQAHQSSYAVTQEGRRVRVTFTEKGEDRAFPTALASCIAKYLRELMLHLLNGWFARRVPGLEPTAGYWTDGKRFLRDIAAVVAAEAIPRSRLVRSR